MEISPAREAPLELYLEGNVVFRQGERTIYAQRMYYDVRRETGIVLGTDDFIENRHREGYRLNPALREVARADLQALVEPMSQA